MTGKSVRIVNANKGSTPAMWCMEPEDGMGYIGDVFSTRRGAEDHAVKEGYVVINRSRASEEGYLIRMPSALRQEVEKAARENNRTVSQEVVSRLEGVKPVESRIADEVLTRIQDHLYSCNNR